MLPDGAPSGGHGWRAITIATPTLWTDIIIPLSDERHLASNAVRLYVERSGSCHIYPTRRYHRNWNQNPVIHDILFPIPTRLKNITRFRSRDPLLAILKATPFPILESLRCCVTQFLSPGTMWQFDVAKLFDLLRDVDQTLKSLRFRTPDAVLQDCISSASYIQFLELVNPDRRFTSQLLTFISAPNLYTLTLGGYAGGLTSHFTTFHAPRLAHLELDGSLFLILKPFQTFPGGSRT